MVTTEGSILRFTFRVATELTSGVHLTLTLTLTLTPLTLTLVLALTRTLPLITRTLTSGSGVHLTLNLTLTITLRSGIPQVIITRARGLTGVQYGQGYVRAMPGVCQGYVRARARLNNWAIQVLCSPASCRSSLPIRDMPPEHPGTRDRVKSNNWGHGQCQDQGQGQCEGQRQDQSRGHRVLVVVLFIRATADSMKPQGHFESGLWRCLALLRGSALG